MEINVINNKELNIAGVTHIGVSEIEKTFNKLINWANSKDLLENSESKFGRLFYDSFKDTPPDKIRMCIFLTTQESFNTEGEINRLTIKKGKCIVGRFEITQNEFEKSWTNLFIWMNKNGYKRSSENPFEIYQNDYRKHPENKFIVDLYIPIE